MKKKIHEAAVKTVQRVLVAFVLLILTGLLSLFAAEVTFFGPKQYTRGKGKPVTIEENFIVPLNYAGPNFKISLLNGSPDGNNRVSSAEIKPNQVSPQIPTASYTLTAVNPGGTTTKQVTVTVIFPVPTVPLLAAPIYVKPVNSTNLTWTSFAPHTVSIEPNMGAVELNGSLSVKLSDTTSFTITAPGYGGSQTAPAIVYIDGNVPVISISEPPAGAFLPRKNITLKGSIIDNSPVTFFVNDNQVPPGANNEFEVSLQQAVPLIPGF